VRRQARPHDVGFTFRKPEGDAPGAFFFSSGKSSEVMDSGAGAGAGAGIAILGTGFGGALGKLIG
jgi:hypothetical protein